jgi:hypothetical protein
MSLGPCKRLETKDDRPGEADEDGVGRWLVWRTFGGVTGGGGGNGSSTALGERRNGLFETGSF